jgi:hypothetical protein
MKKEFSLDYQVSNEYYLYQETKFASEDIRYKPSRQDTIKPPPIWKRKVIFRNIFGYLKTHLNAG